MRKYAWQKPAIIIPIIISLVTVIYFLQSKINHMRRSEALNIADFGPTEVIPIILMGSFRGIIVDLLWIKGIAKHEEKNYFEVLAINNLIAKLQPRFPAVWMFQAWNMSYNIAHEWESPENKWKWIKAGLDFAEKGALKNPKSGDLFFEINHIYYHKFSSKSFEYADYYRKRLIEETGKDNFEHALYWIRRSLKHETMFRSRVVVERALCNLLLNASLQAEKDGKFKKSLGYATQAIFEWESYLKRYPEDPDGRAKSSLKYISEQKLQLEQYVN